MKGLKGCMIVLQKRVAQVKNKKKFWDFLDSAPGVFFLNFFHVQLWNFCLFVFFFLLDLWINFKGGEPPEASIPPEVATGDVDLSNEVPKAPCPPITQDMCKSSNCRWEQDTEGCPICKCDAGATPEVAPQQPRSPPAVFARTDDPNSPVCDVAIAGARKCHADANCHQYQDGSCCKCNAGSYGNGKECLAAGKILFLGRILAFKLNFQSPSTIFLVGSSFKVFFWFLNWIF